jgi:glutathione synthase/RimK-type ligase-like ATP-grasp enzyme
MKLLIVTTKKDLSCDKIIEEAKKKDIDILKIFYEELQLNDFKPEKFKEFDFCILRDPYNTGINYSIYFKKMLKFFGEHKSFDYRAYNKHPDYEDKLFQHNLFGNALKMPKLHSLIDKVKSFPIIIKKRVSSRGKNIFVIDTKEELEKFLSEYDITDYIIEEFLDVKKDLRIFLINNEIIGAVERKTRFKENGNYTGIGVKILDKYKPSEEIKKKAILVSKIIGSDFCGVDFIIGKNENNYLLECNISPQFVSSERILEVNIAEKIINFILKKFKN